MSHYRSLREEIRDRIRLAVSDCAIAYDEAVEPNDVLPRAIIACDEDAISRNTRGRSCFLDWKFQIYIMVAVPSSDVTGAQYDLIDTVVMQLDPFNESTVPAPPGAFAGLSNNFGVTSQQAIPWDVEDGFIAIRLTFEVQTEVYV